MIDSYYEFDVDSNIWPNRKELYNQFVSKHRELINTKPTYKKIYYNFDAGSSPEFDKLYDTFIEACEHIFGKLTISSNNRRNCWVCVSDRYTNQSVHNHKDSAVINGVYYFSVPDIKSGKLRFYDEANLLLNEFQPTPNTLILFPNYLHHQPSNCDSDEYRISINMELLCEEKVWND